jgi:hypothetical protein
MALAYRTRQKHFGECRMDANGPCFGPCVSAIGKTPLAEFQHLRQYGLNEAKSSRRVDRTADPRQR